MINTIATDTGLIAKYHQHLPVPEDACVVSLSEGNTSLIKLHSLSEPDRGVSIYAKVEGENPTGSFKDRGMTVAITMALAAGNNAVICA